MLVCPRCDRHVLANAHSCPFCGGGLETTRASTVMVTSLVLGLALFGCGDKDSTTDDAADGTVTDSSTGSMSATSTTGTTGTMDDWGEEAAAYADPSDSWWETDTLSTTGTDDGTTGDSSTTGDDSTGSTGDTDSDGDTDTDGDTSTGSTDAGD